MCLSRVRREPGRCGQLPHRVLGVNGRAARAGDDELPVMRDIVARIDTLSDLIQDLTTFARPRPPRLAVVSVRQLLDEALTTLRRDPISASLDIHVECDDGTMTADIEMMRSTFTSPSETPV